MLAFYEKGSYYTWKEVKTKPENLQLSVLWQRGRKNSGMLLQPIPATNYWTKLITKSKMDLHKHLCFSYPALKMCQTLKRVNPMPLTVKISLQPKFRCVAARREHGKKRRAWEGMRPPGSLAPIPPSLWKPHCLTLFQAVLWSSDILLDNTKDGELNLQICPSSV